MFSTEQNHELIICNSIAKKDFIVARYIVQTWCISCMLNDRLDRFWQTWELRPNCMEPEVEVKCGIRN